MPGERRPAPLRLGGLKLADDLRRFLDGEPIWARRAGVPERTWKWCRRNPAWATAAVVAVLALVGLAWLSAWALTERATAQEERRQAYQNLDVAIETIDAALLELSEEVRERPGMQKVQNALLEKAFPPLEKLIGRYQADPRLRSELCRVHQRAGELYHLTGDSPRALKHLRQAVAVGNQLVEEEASADRRAALASALRSLGNVSRRQPEHRPEALRHLEKAGDLCGELAWAEPNSLKRLLPWAEVLCDLAEVHKGRSGGARQAIALLEQARDLLRPLEADPASLPCLARAHSYLGGLLTDNGRKDEARKAYGEAVEARQKLYDARPGRLSLRRDLAETLNDYGWLLHQVGKPDEARVYYLRSREHRKALAEENPTVPQFAHLYALTTNSLGLLHMIWSGKRKEAREFLEEAEKVRTSRLAGSKLPWHVNSLGHVWQNQAQILRAEGKKRQALELLDRILALRKQVCQAHPDNTLYRRHRAYTLCVRGQVLLEMGKTKQAGDALGAALAEHRELAKKNPTRKDFQDDRVLALVATGEWHRAGGRYAEAHRLFQQAAEESRALKGESPEHARHHAGALNERGQELARQGKQEAALADFQAAGELGKQICAQQPGMWEHRDVHGRSLYLLGSWQRRWKRPGPAREALEQARRIQQELHRLCQPHPDLTSSLALTLADLGLLALAHGPAERRPEALEMLKQADALHRQAAAAAPEAPLFAQRQRAHQKLLSRFRIPEPTRESTMRTLSLGIFLAVAATVAAAGETAPKTALVKARMAFADAIKPYTGYAYTYSGHVGADGKVHNGGLGCSAFTSVVLHRLRDGEDWLRRFDPKVHQWYGDKAAKHFALKKAGAFPSATLLDADRTAALVKANTLKAGALYYFNARKEKNGHVGFVRFGAGGGIEQWHYSSISKGLYRGDFRGWFRASLYRAGGTVEFYAVPE